MDQTNTHVYDGKLIERVKQLSDILDSIKNIGREERLQHFQILRQNLANLFSKVSASPEYQTCFRFFDALVANPAFDPTNGISAEDMLYLCYKLSEIPSIKDEILELLFIQFQDMATGFCPQGQTTRLFQIVISFVENLKNP